MRHTLRAALVLGVLALCGAAVGDEPPPRLKSNSVEPVAPSNSVAPGFLGLPAAARKGIKWLVIHQNPDGGWSEQGQGGGTSDLGYTALGGLALLATGSTPSEGTFSPAIGRALEFVSDRLSRDGALAATREPPPTTPRTQLHNKIGTMADLGISALFLMRAHGGMATESANRKLDRLCKATIAELERAQQDDGSWNLPTSWAPLHGTAFVGCALHEARARNLPVAGRTLARLERFTLAQVAVMDAPPTPAPHLRKGAVVTPRAESEGSSLGAAGAGNAGVLLYSVSQGLAELTRTPELRRRHARQIDELVAKSAEKGVLGGFGSMGGEEYIAYALIAESLLRVDGNQARTWHASIVDQLSKLQNADGSWNGHHCITARTPVTGLAILALSGAR
jgi:hypothetical protein